MYKERVEQYNAFKDAIHECRECNLPNKRYYLATGSITATVMIIGQAPSLYREQNIKKTGSTRHFTGKSKKVFEEFLKRLNLDYDDAWVTNAVKCITPRKGHGSYGKCKTHLRREIRIVQPREIFIFGKIACKTVFDSSLPYTSFRREADGIVYHILPHPMTAIYTPHSGRETFFNALDDAISYRKKHHLVNQKQLSLFEASDDE